MNLLTTADTQGVKVFTESDVQDSQQCWQALAYQALRVLWAGGMWTTGAFLVPILFHALDREQAVSAAVAVFRSFGVLGFFLLAALCLLHTKAGASKLALKALWLAALAAGTLHFLVIPLLLENSQSQEKEPIWHVLSTVLFSVQMACATVVALGKTITASGEDKSSPDNATPETTTLGHFYKSPINVASADIREAF